MTVPADRPAVAAATARLYGHLWRQFSPDEFRRMADDFWRRWNLVGLPDEWFRGRRCLDVGCGGGRACWSLAELGVERVVGLDYGADSVCITRDRLAPYRAQVRVTQGSALALPFPAGTFDFVHCNGVLHHTPDPEEGFRELVRVCRAGGWLYLGLYGRGGLLGAAVGICRRLGKIIPFRWTEAIVRRLSTNPMFWYSVLDTIYVPIRRSFAAAEVRAWADAAGLVEYQRTESRFGFARYPRVIKGEGTIMVLARKPE